uniref:Uncharacterized protein n=1 Tax=Callorhinchus milii TaxID=7868 RepID=A0A4W3IXY0_CALMI
SHSHSQWVLKEIVLNCPPRPVDKSTQHELDQIFTLGRRPKLLDRQGFAGRGLGSERAAEGGGRRVTKGMVEKKGLETSLEEGVVLGEVMVPIDLFKKQPSGRQSFRLSNVQSGNSSGSITAEVSHVPPARPGEVKPRQLPTLLPARKVEKDRTVMPCGTVITTVTAVKTQKLTAAFLHVADSPTKSPADGKEAEPESLAVGECALEASVSKALSSSDTELMLLNGADPVAEAAIRQLTESARHKLKSPVRKSTIIISGVSKVRVGFPLQPTCPSVPAREQSPSSAGPLAVAEPAGGDDGEARATPCAGGEEAEEEEEEVVVDGLASKCSNGSLEDAGLERRSSISIDGSVDAGTVKKPRGGFMRSGPKFFFRRRHHQKDPGMSQSHNDLVFLDQPTPLEKERKKGGGCTCALNQSAQSLCIRQSR